MITEVNKDSVGRLLKDSVHKEPAFMSELISEIDTDLKNSTKKRLVETVKEDVEEYDDVFKALA